MINLVVENKLDMTEILLTMVLLHHLRHLLHLPLVDLTIIEVIDKAHIHLQAASHPVQTRNCQLELLSA